MSLIYAFVVPVVVFTRVVEKVDRGCLTRLDIIAGLGWNAFYEAVRARISPEILVICCTNCAASPAGVALFLGTLVPCSAYFMRTAYMYLLTRNGYLPAPEV